ncbi:hypothetical protein DSM19430T_10890 [Desulfovibrio psychrotolerans]|uniref:Uncharacterized protein n=1 Tax=Desulfovibrio psychrotolerans TaxID=415242 RepID=A0A7J0BTF0_9BACT|nr:hypothetical protein DSM19430T_10890 [Desulfovibrio psychrotolerans]
MGYALRQQRTQPALKNGNGVGAAHFHEPQGAVQFLMETGKKTFTKGRVPEGISYIHNALPWCCWVKTNG